MGPILVTGGAGFVGANLVRGLLERGSEVRVLDDLSDGQAGYLDGLGGGLHATWASINDSEALSATADRAQAIVHLAARSGVQPSVERPETDFEINVRGTFNVLDMARRLGVPRVIFASSGAVAAAGEPPFNEDMLPSPLAPYGASKAYGEVALAAFARTYGFVGVALRFSNLYGNFCSHKSSVIARFLQAAASGTPLQINGDGHQTRDFMHVSDVVRAISTALSAEHSGVYQLGTGRETSVLELVDLASQAVGRQLQVSYGPPLPADARRNYTDPSRAREQLGWEATVDLACGLADTWAWLAAAEPGRASAAQARL